MSNATLASSPLVPPLADALENLEKELAGLNSELDRLTGRLEPVCTMSPVAEPERPPQPRQQHGSVVSTIWTQVGRVELARRNVRYLLDALDV